ncbi:MAG: hypothetical protein MUO80_00520 [Dehalococcoidia bacterium]|nr:hypothetical protein [Dehalococcoidia bacterium]
MSETERAEAEIELTERESAALEAEAVIEWDNCPRCGGYVWWNERGVGRCKHCGETFESRREFKRMCWHLDETTIAQAERLQTTGALPSWSIQTRDFLARCLIKLRRNRQYQRNKQQTRLLMGLPSAGYSRLEVRRKLLPLAQAYLSYMHNKRSSRKQKDDAILFAGYSLMIAKFAHDHPLAQGRPMPTFTAFRELFYRRPPSQFVLSGYFSRRDELQVWLEDAQTKAPYRVRRLVKQALNNKDKAAKEIRIFQQEPDWGKWEFKQMQ